MFFYASLMKMSEDEWFYSWFCGKPSGFSGSLKGLLNLLMKNKMENVGAGQWSAVLAFCRGQRSSGADNLECVHPSVKTQFTDHRRLFSENTDSKNMNPKWEDMTSNTGPMKRDSTSSKQLNSHSFGRHFWKLTKAHYSCVTSDTTDAQKYCL